MARITVEDCLAQIPNRFQLVLAATYRARMLEKVALKSDVDVARYALRHRLVD